MLDRFKAFWVQVFNPVVQFFLRHDVSPNAVTIVGTIGVVAGALVFFPTGHLLIGVLVITCFVFSDLIDGQMARLTGKGSKFGAFLDSTLDRLGDAAIFGGLALYFANDGHSKLYLALSLVCLAMGSVTSYARSRAESLGFNAKVGIAERSDRLVAILVMTGFSGIFHTDVLAYIALWALAAASTITVVQRIWAVWQQSKAAGNPAV